MGNRPTRKHCTLYKFLPAVCYLHLPAVRSYLANKHCKPYRPTRKHCTLYKLLPAICYVHLHRKASTLMQTAVLISAAMPDTLHARSPFPVCCFVELGFVCTCATFGSSMIMSISIGWAFQVASALSPGINSEGGLVLVYWREGMITRHWDGEEHMWMLPQEPLACCRLPD